MVNCIVPIIIITIIIFFVLYFISINPLVAVQDQSDDLREQFHLYRYDWYPRYQYWYRYPYYYPYAYHYPIC